MTDINKILGKMISVDEVPKTNRGGLRHTWKPILDKAVGKGYFKISEDDICLLCSDRTCQILHAENSSLKMDQRFPM